MAFIRKRISQTKRRTPSYQLIETYREGGKVKQRIIENLGPYPTIAEAIRGEQEMVKFWEEVYREHPISAANETLQKRKDKIQRLKSLAASTAKARASERKRAERGK
jgi:hypothetical protein